MNYHRGQMRNLDTYMYRSMLYFFFIARNFAPGREWLCMAEHISLKQLMRVSLSMLSSTRVSDLVFRMESDSIREVRTKVFMQQLFPRPQKSDSQMRYLLMHWLLVPSFVNFLFSCGHFSVTASRICKAVVQFRLNLNASKIFPSMALSSATEYDESVTSMQFFILGGYISSYLLAIHRQAIPTSWYSCFEISHRDEQALRYAKARKRVCSLSQKERWTSVIQSMRICLISSVIADPISTFSFCCSPNMNASISLSYQTIGSLTSTTIFLSKECDLVRAVGKLLLFSEMELFLERRVSMLVISRPKVRLGGMFLSLTYILKYFN